MEGPFKSRPDLQSESATDFAVTAIERGKEDSGAGAELGISSIETGDSPEVAFKVVSSVPIHIPTPAPG